MIELSSTTSIIATVIACAYYIHRDIKEDMNCHREDTKCHREDMKNQMARSDRLYEMFIDLLKEARK